MLAYTTNAYGFNHAVSIDDLILLQNFREIRHLNVHGEWRIDERFITKKFQPKYFPKIKLIQGRKLQLTDELIWELWGVAFDVQNFLISL